MVAWGEERGVSILCGGDRWGLQGYLGARVLPWFSMHFPRAMQVHGDPAMRALIRQSSARSFAPTTPASPAQSSGACLEVGIHQGLQGAWNREGARRSSMTLSG